jgi:hypothetical protein
MSSSHEAVPGLSVRPSRPPSAGRHADDTPEAAIEGRKVVEARLVSDRRDRTGRPP